MIWGTALTSLSLRCLTGRWANMTHLAGWLQSFRGTLCSAGPVPAHSSAREVGTVTGTLAGFSRMQGFLCLPLAWWPESPPRGRRALAHLPSRNRERGWGVEGFPDSTPRTSAPACSSLPAGEATTHSDSHLPGRGLTCGGTRPVLSLQASLAVSLHSVQTLPQRSRAPRAQAPRAPCRSVPDCG